MNLRKPLLALSKPEAAVILARFGQPNAITTSGKNFIGLSPVPAVKFYIMPASASVSGIWNEDNCSDCIVFYAYRHNMPFCRIAFDLTGGMTGVDLINAITAKVIIPLIARAPELYAEYYSGQYKLCAKMA